MIISRYILLVFFLIVGNAYAQKSEEGILNKGKEYYKKQMYGEAISEFTIAIKINPLYADAYFNRGLAYNHKRDFDQAISDYKKTIEINPNCVKAYLNRALVYFSKQEYDKSWEDVRKVWGLGGKIDPVFLKELKKASGKE